MIYQVHLYRPGEKNGGALVETFHRVEAANAVEACRTVSPVFSARRNYTTRRNGLPDNAHFQANAAGTKGVAAMALIPFTGLRESNS